MPNMSSVGKRNSTAPIPKSILLLSGLLASLVVQITGLNFTIYLYNIYFKDRL